MKELIFLCVRPDGSVPSMEVRRCSDEASMREAAAALLAQHGSCDVVEVWDGDRRTLSVGAEPREATLQAHVSD